MAITVLVVDDRVQSAQALALSKALHGCLVSVASTWAEATDTLTYQQLARSELPALVLGPLSKDAIESLGILRDQGIDLPTVLYTENRSHDQDQTLIRQYRLRGIVHKPFSIEDRQRMLHGMVAPHADAALATPPQVEPVPLPPAPSTAALRTRMKTPPMGSTNGDFDDLTGSSRASSVRSQAPARRQPAEGELPSGVQKLLMDPTGAGAAPAPSAQAAAAGPARGAASPDASQGSPAGVTDGRRLPEPRSVTILIVDDRFGTAAQVLEHVGAPGQRCHIAPSYQEALPILERFMASSMGCELVVGPLSADGVAAVREYRKRNWGNHVIFYTESATQSQDARLPLQYGCMTILRRAGMSEPLEQLIAQLRYHPRQRPAPPQEHVRTGATRTGVGAAPTTGVHSGHMPAAPKAPESRIVPPAPATAPPVRIRRSVLPPPVAPTPGSHDAPMSIEVPTGSARHSSRVVVCRACGQEFVVTASGNLPVRCSHCQALNQLA